MEIVEKWLLDLIEDIKLDKEEKPKKTLRLATEEWSRLDPSWDFVEQTIHATNGYFKSSNKKPYGKFCILEFVDDRKDYIQTKYDSEYKKAKIQDSWRLERREWYSDGRWTHYYARLATDGENETLISSIHCVIDAFKAFYYSKYWPEYLVWVRYDDLNIS